MTELSIPDQQRAGNSFTDADFSLSTFTSMFNNFFVCPHLVRIRQTLSLKHQTWHNLCVSLWLIHTSADLFNRETNTHWFGYFLSGRQRFNVGVLGCMRVCGGLLAIGVSTTNEMTCTNADQLLTLKPPYRLFFQFLFLNVNSIAF